MALLNCLMYLLPNVRTIRIIFRAENVRENKYLENFYPLFDGEKSVRLFPGGMETLIEKDTSARRIFKAL